jgi:predicted glycogen debranching enzyme
MWNDERAEWLEADGLGGFASGTASGIRRRRYHALLLSATTPPTGRVALVNGLDAWLDTPSGSFALSTQRYAPDVLYPDGTSRMTSFTRDPWPTWSYELPDGTSLTQEILVRHGVGTTVIVWTLVRANQRSVLRVRPFLSGRDYHALHQENSAFRFSADRDGAAIVFGSYAGVPEVAALSNGDYRHQPDWYRRFRYADETERGLDDTEDLASPGEFAWPLRDPGDEAILLLDPRGRQADRCAEAEDAVRLGAQIRVSERRRRSALGGPLDVAADAYIVKRRGGRTVVAGYPWFTDWGRDTFIALRGLCLATGRFADARDILVEWAGAVSEGMLPNRFPDGGETPEFNAVDASLWYIVASGELLQGAPPGSLRDDHRRAIERAVTSIVQGYAAGTRYGIRMDADGLLAAGAPGVQLTWMDARVGDRVITPRIGKPVEVQALWINALAVAAAFEPRWKRTMTAARRSFEQRFWRDDIGRLADVVDVDHVPGTRDDTFRPNQILAVGGLPLSLLNGRRARRVIDAVERTLLTPLGLRSLAPDEPGYAPAYGGGPATRDAAYHQGTVWPWLMGPFVEAWVRVRGNTPEAQDEARRRFLEALLMHVDGAGLGHVSEIADAEPPFVPRGCPFQAWSLGELIRLERGVLVGAPAAALAT